jgi:hypothetical protein
MAKDLLPHISNLSSRQSGSEAPLSLSLGIRRVAGPAPLHNVFPRVLYCWSFCSMR